MILHSIRIPGTGQSVQMSQAGLPVSQEGLLLLDFLAQSKWSFSRAADLGCGSGLLSIGLAAIFPAISVTGIEIQKNLFETAEVNIRRNNLYSRIRLVCGDLRSREVYEQAGSNDLVVLNPPFRKLRTGKTSPSESRSLSNHEHCGNLSDFIRIASILLVHKGVIALVMLPERLAEVLKLMEARHVPACQLQMIHHRQSSDANAVLILGRKGCRTSLAIRSPILLNE